MSPNATTDRDAMLFSYVIASADMRHIERSEREIYLRHRENAGPLLRGEMPDCGPDCYANLGQILLEYVMSCEGCKDDIVEAEMAQGFGERLGKALTKRLNLSGQDDVEHLTGAFQCVADSLDTLVTLEQTEDTLRYTFAAAPIQDAAQQAGIKRGQPMARRALIALCGALAETLAPDWQLEGQSVTFAKPLTELMFVKAA